jgi:hypothetical protein
MTERFDSKATIFTTFDQLCLEKIQRSGFTPEVLAVLETRYPEITDPEIEERIVKDSLEAIYVDPLKAVNQVLETLKERRHVKP